MNELHEYRMNLNRREFLSKTSLGLGAAALASILPGCGIKSNSGLEGFASQGSNALDVAHFAPKAKRIIYLFQSGGPSQIELFDHKPKLENYKRYKEPRLCLTFTCALPNTLKT